MTLASLCHYWWLLRGGRFYRHYITGAQHLFSFYLYPPPRSGIVPTSVASGTPPHTSPTSEAKWATPLSVHLRSMNRTIAIGCLNLFKLICDTNQSYEIGKKGEKKTLNPYKIKIRVQKYKKI